MFEIKSSLGMIFFENQICFLNEDLFVKLQIYIVFQNTNMKNQIQKENIIWFRKIHLSNNETVQQGNREPIYNVKKKNYWK